MARTEIPAVRGNPYLVSRDKRTKIVRLQRHNEDGSTSKIVFSPADLVSVTNALHDLLEGVE